MIELIAHTNVNHDLLTEYAARVCYDSVHKMTNKPNGDFINKLIMSGHTSTFEHWSITFGVSLETFLEDIIGFMKLQSNPGVITNFYGDMFTFTINYRHIINGILGNLRLRYEVIS